MRFFFFFFSISCELFFTSGLEYSAGVVNHWRWKIFPFFSIVFAKLVLWIGSFWCLKLDIDYDYFSSQSTIYCSLQIFINLPEGVPRNTWAAGISGSSSATLLLRIFTASRSGAWFLWIVGASTTIKFSSRPVVMALALHFFFSRQRQYSRYFSPPDDL